MVDTGGAVSAPPWVAGAPGAGELVTMVCEVLKLVFHVLYAPRCKVATPRHGRLGAARPAAAMWPPHNPLPPRTPPAPAIAHKDDEPIQLHHTDNNAPHDMHIHVHIRSRTVDSTVTVDCTLHRRLRTVHSAGTRLCVLCVVAECGETVARRTRHRLCRARGSPARGSRAEKTLATPPRRPGRRRRPAGARTARDTQHTGALTRALLSPLTHNLF